MRNLAATPDPLFDEPLPELDGEVTLATDAELYDFLRDELEDYGRRQRAHSRPTLHGIVGNTLNGIIIDDV